MPILFLLCSLIFISCQQSKENKVFAEKGLEITDSTGKSLVGALTGAMQEGGISHALKFCNENALDITDKMSQKYGVKISRIAAKNRNENNYANEKELELLASWEEKIKNNEPLEPELLTKDKKKIFYRPITTQGMCLSCHGTVGEFISNENYEIIESLYPNDKAIGFEMGSLRGAWKVEF